MSQILARFRGLLNNKTLLLSVLVVMLFMLAVPTFAQDTPVPLDIPVNPIFVQANIWMGVFAPIVAIGIGIAVSLAILGFIGKQIINAFH
jgi:hypothetical protein